MSKAKRFSLAFLMMLVLLVLTSCGGPEYTYKQAQELLAKGEYSSAAEKFGSIPEYEDAPVMTKYSQACALCEAGDYEKGIAALEALGDVEGCAERIEHYSALAGPEFNYKKAQTLLSQGKYAEAAAKFENLGSYEDAATLTKYCNACVLCETGDYEKGIAALEALGDFEGCAERIEHYSALAGPEFNYKKAQALLSQGKYAEAAKKFESLGSYEEATTLTMYCKACALCESGNFEAGITALEKLGAYKDCAYRITYYTARSWDDNSVGTTEYEWMERAKSIYNENPLYLDSAERIAALEERIATAKKTLYDNAVADAESGRYNTARTTFSRLGNYSDCNKRFTYYGIRKAEDALGETTDQDAVIAVAKQYEDMGQYLDCEKRAAALSMKADSIVAVKYSGVQKLIDEGKYAEAEKALAVFGNYGNEQVTAYYYAIAEKYLVAEQWANASAAFAKAGNYSDAAKRVLEPYYTQGEKLMAEGKWDEASAAFKKAGNYSDATKRITYCGIRKEEDKLGATTSQDSVIAVAKKYTALGSLLDCRDRAKALTDRADAIVTARYTEVDKLIADGKCAEAEQILAAFGTYGNGQVQAKYYSTAEKYLSQSKWDEASAAFKKAGTYSDATKRINEPYYKQGEALMAAGKWDEASVAYKKAGNYSDATNRITYCSIRKEEDKLGATTSQDSMIAVANSYTAMGEYLDSADRAKALTDRADAIVTARYAEVDKLIADGKCAEAEKILAAFGTYGNEQVQAKYYAAAEKYLADGKWDEASAAFKKAGTYSDAAKRINEPYYTQGEALLAAGKWDEASAAFKKAGNYSDATKRITYCGIRKEEDRLGATTSQDMVIAVAKKYTALGTLLDCPDRAKALTDRADDIVTARYAEVDKLIADGKCAEAEKILMIFGTYGNGQVQAKYYAAAEKYLAGQKYVEAYKLFMSISTFSDSKSKAESFYIEYLQDTFRRAKIGSYVKFGVYEQDSYASNGKEGIEWLVLDKVDNRILVISRYALDNKRYNQQQANGTWASCTLRKWLNNDFLNAAFSSAEKEMIPTVTVSADKNPSNYLSKPGADTQDKVFLLSILEAEKYFTSNIARMCPSTAYAKQQGVYNESIGYYGWWLRTTGRDQREAAYVTTDGQIVNRGNMVHFDNYYVRPALWIDLGQ